MERGEQQPSGEIRAARFETSDRRIPFSRFVSPLIAHVCRLGFFLSSLLSPLSPLDLMEPHSRRLAPILRDVDLEIREEAGRFVLEQSEHRDRHPANLQLGAFAAA